MLAFSGAKQSFGVGKEESLGLNSCHLEMRGKRCQTIGKKRIVFLSTKLVVLHKLGHWVGKHRQNTHLVLSRKMARNA
eukprot:6492363-Amphidinium_carterae.2